MHRESRTGSRIKKIVKTQYISLSVSFFVLFVCLFVCLVFFVCLFVFPLKGYPFSPNNNQVQFWVIFLNTSGRVLWAMESNNIDTVFDFGPSNGAQTHGYSNILSYLSVRMFCYANCPLRLSNVLRDRPRPAANKRTIFLIIAQHPFNDYLVDVP